MALSDEVTSRYSNELLVQLTNQGNLSATTVNSTRLAAACTDAAAEFETLTGAEFDVTNAKHLVAGLEGVMMFLHDRAQNGPDAEAHRKKFESKCEGIRLTIGGNARIAPTTNSLLTPSDEVPEGREVRPDFDRGSLGIFLRPPRGGYPAADE